MSHADGKNIFISYRREDSAGDTSRLVSSLKNFIASERIFIDTETIPYGEDFTKVIRNSVRQCEVQLVIIGKKWMQPLQDGSNALMAETNWVRIEIATALKQGKLVIPILIDGAKMPEKSDLPAVLSSFYSKQAKEVYYRTWDNDINDLANFLRSKSIPFEEDERFTKRANFIFNKWTLVLLVAISVGLYLLLQNIMKPEVSDNLNINQPTQTKYVIAKPGISPLKAKRNLLLTHDITGVWKPENANAKYYYKIMKTPQGLVMELWSSGILSAKGKVIQNDSLVEMSYENERFSEIFIKAKLSKDGKTMQGSKSFGTKINGNVGIGFTLIKNSE